MKLNLLLLVIVINCLSIQASDYRVSARVDSINKTAYYKIEITPEILSYSREDYADIRLVSLRGEEIPYIFTSEKPSTFTTGFLKYEIIENQYLEKKKQSRVVIHNKDKRVISSLHLIVRNSDVQKEMTLKGSDDARNWFIIQKGKPERTGSFNETSEILELNFPKVDYNYLEITTNDKYTDPIQFIEAGFYNAKQENGLYTEIPLKEFSQKDSSNKNTYLTVRFENQYEFNKIVFDVSGPDLFKRNVYYGYFSEQNDKQVFNHLGSFELSSTEPHSVETDNLRLKEIVFVVENYDNKPLRFNQVKILQLKKYLIAKLEKGETYFLRTGNIKLNAPEYDLKYFTNEFTDSLSMVSVGNISEVGSQASIQSNSDFSKIIMWTVIILVIGLLGFLSVRLIKEMGTR